MTKVTLTEEPINFEDVTLLASVIYDDDKTEKDKAGWESLSQAKRDYYVSEALITFGFPVTRKEKPE